MIRLLNGDLPPLEWGEVTDPVELAQARARRALFDRNWEWFKEHAQEIYANHRGKVVCISGQKVFAADTTEEVLATARAAFPDDEGRFTLIIPRERMVRIYAHSRRMASLL